MLLRCSFCFFFFFNDTATTEIYTLSLHDALPILQGYITQLTQQSAKSGDGYMYRLPTEAERSEEHTSELQSRLHLVCRLLLEKKKNKRSRRWSARNRPCPLPLLYSRIQ